MYVTTSASQNRRRENEIIVRSDLKCSVTNSFENSPNWKITLPFPWMLMYITFHCFSHYNHIFPIPYS